MSFVVLFVLSELFAQHRDAGTTVYSFLDVSLGSRPTALGNAYTALADDIYALFYNPAGLYAIRKPHYLVTYQNYVSDMNSGLIGAAQPFRDQGVIAAGLSYLDFGLFEGLDLEGLPTGKFHPLSLVFYSGFARMWMEDRLAAGAVLKLIYSAIERYNSVGFAVDVGLKYHPLTFKKLWLGATLKQIGYQVTPYDDERFPLPLNTQLGIAYLLSPRPITWLTFEVSKDFESFLLYKAGLEWHTHRNFCLRAGYKTTTSELLHFKDRLAGDSFSSDPPDLLDDFTFGFGTKGRKFNFDVSLSTFSVLSTNYQLSLIFK